MNTYGFRNIVRTVAIALALGFAAGIPTPAQKIAHISATARGTSTQLGRIISIDLRINEFSTAADQSALLEAFRSHGSQGLYNALDKMKSKGRIAITGTLGYDLNYIRLFTLPDGTRKIRFVTDRPITFGEVWGSTRSMDYSITMGEITVGKAPAKGKAKHIGVLMPAALVKLNKQGDLEIETFQNPWELMNIKVW